MGVEVREDGRALSGEDAVLCNEIWPLTPYSKMR